MIFPTVIDVENVRGLCNARCTMCSIESPKARPGMVMSDQVFEQILHRYEALAQPLTQVNLVGIGEPLIDPHVCEKIRLSKRVLPATRLTIITNGALLTPALSIDILQSGCDDIIFSIDSRHKEAYEGIRIRLSFEKTMDCTHRFIHERNRGGYRTKVMVRMIEQELNKGEWPEYVQYWQQHLSPEMGDMILFFPVHKWPENEKSAQLSHVICPYVFNRMSITAEGKIQLCCVDTGADFYLIGSVLEQDPLSAFNGEIFSMVRKKMEDGLWNDLAYCSRCNVPMQREKRLSAQPHPRNEVLRNG